MNRYDWLVTAVIVCMSVCVWAASVFLRVSEQSLEKVAVVVYKDEEVLRIDLTKDHTYTLSATMGEVTIEVRDGAIRVEKETSYYHYCSLQGWVKDSYVPIVCLPNELFITIQGVEASEEDLHIQ
ncbi:MAG: NusG domain II-containing protein [Erysipelotrichaceae bacterium]|nr:NusG domain II-containing protein [Erysipelotrichaceae bacterium]